MAPSMTSQIKQESLDPNRHRPRSFGSDRLISSAASPNLVLPIQKNSASDENGKQQPQAKRASSCLGSYVLEPMSFIQSLAECIIIFCTDQFMYSRFLNRLVTGNSKPHTKLNQHSHHNSHYALPKLVLFDQLHQSHLNMLSSTPSSLNCLSSNTSGTVTNISHSDITDQAQEATSSLLFYCSLYSSIPLVIMTILLTANCSQLGRKTILVNRLFVCIVRYAIFTLMCIYPSWPDSLFYIIFIMDGFVGGTGAFYMSKQAYDLCFLIFYIYIYNQL